ncbi:MAG: hypothetical protein EXR30_04775 [Betaproteobacteria bacterium]|nr:hypothetical protein [Betaproteobacteria bacterium]
MSGEGESAPAPVAKPAASLAVDPIEDLAKKIFIELCAQVHAQPGEKPEHKKLVEVSFRLAEAFQAGNLEFNTAARARADAKTKASVDVNKIEIDFDAISSKK